MIKVIFMGTPDFAIPSLDTLEASKDCEIIALVTQPDKPRGRGKKVLPSPVKAWGLERNIPVLQPEKASSEDFIHSISSLEPDLIITAAYGQILKKELLDIPKLGCINVHASLLPEYRGASPIQQVLIDGRDKTGITIMYMDVGMDTGDIIAMKETAIKPSEYADQLHDRLAVLGGQLLQDVIKIFKEGKPKGIPQDHSRATYCSKIDKSMGEIDWNRSSGDIINLLRGLTPWPGVYTYYSGKRIKVWKAQEWEYSTDDGVIPGTVIKSDSKEGLIIACKDGAISIQQLQEQGGKRLSTEEYLRGKCIPEGTILGK